MIRACPELRSDNEVVLLTAATTFSKDATNHYKHNSEEYLLVLHSGSSWACVTLKSITESLGFVLLIAKVLYSLKVDEGINRLVIGLVVLFILHSTEFVSPFCDGKGPYNVQNHCDCCNQREQKLIDRDENDAHKGHLLWEMFGVTQLVFLSHQGTICSLLEHHNTSTSVGTMLNNNIPIKKLRIVEEKENREETHTRQSMGQRGI